MDKKEQVRLAYYHELPIVFFIRMAFWLLLVIAILYQFFLGASLKIPLFLLTVFFIGETFLTFKVCKIKPKMSLSNGPVDQNNVFSYCTKDALTSFMLFPATQKMLRYLTAFPQARFVLFKAEIAPKELQFLSIDKQLLLQKALEIAQKSSGKYITTMDIIGAYVLLTEEKTKLLFAKQLKEQDLIRIISWARIDNYSEEQFRQPQAYFTGVGIGEALVSGWTHETKKYTKDITYNILRKKTLLVGRENEYKRVIDALQKSEHNNVLLVGEPGVGKWNLIESFIFESLTAQLPNKLNHRRILELMIGPLIAGATDRGELELRLQAIIEEVSHSLNVVLIIPQFENIIGSSSYNIDLSGALFPYLKNGTIPIIGTISLGNFKAYLEKNPIKEAFEVILLEEPEKEMALKMLFQKTSEIETKTKTLLSYQAVVAATDYARRYLPDDVLPGTAVELLEDTAHAVSLSSAPFFANTNKKLVTDQDVIKKIEEKIKVAVAAPQTLEKNLLLNLETKLHERVIDQSEGIAAISESIRRYRTGLTSQNRPISLLFLGPTGVGKTETAKALSQLYYGGEERMVRLDMSEYTGEEGVKRLLGALPGQGDERGELTDKVHDHPNSLVLLDEFEKANPRILDLFLQVLEDGRLTDNKGRTVSFVNCFIIATSNAGSEFIRQEVLKGTPVDKGFHQKLLDYLQTNHLFKPELLNRFDDVITFKPLREAEQREIVKLLVRSLVKKMAEKDITVSFSDSVIEKITKEGINIQFGARPLRRYIQDTIEDLFSQKILRDEIKRGDKIILSTDQNNNLQTTINP